MSQPAGYSRAQIRLHWIVAGLIAAQYLFAEPIEEAARAAQDGIATGFDPVVMSHVVGGVLVMVFALWRLALRARRGVPALPQEESALMKTVAHITHYALYGLMILMPVSGALAWFGGVDVASDAHNTLKGPLLGLIALHVVGALVHQFVLKTNLMARMKHAQD